MLSTKQIQIKNKNIKIQINRITNITSNPCIKLVCACVFKKEMCHSQTLLVHIGNRPIYPIEMI